MFEMKPLQVSNEKEVMDFSLAQKDTSSVQIIKRVLNKMFLVALKFLWNWVVRIKDKTRLGFWNPFETEGNFAKLNLYIA